MDESMRSLILIPVYNEEKYLGGVLRRTLPFAPDILVVDDGSTDQTPEVLKQFPEIRTLRHSKNQGYGATLKTGFEYAVDHGFDCVITMDSDGQHEPSLIPQFVAELSDCDIVSGSRYLRKFHENTAAPAERRRINSLVTDELNACFELGITDAFCGFKAYRTDALRRLKLTEPGYGMPLELWVQAACLKLRIRELAVPLVYLDPSRSFGEVLDNGDARLTYYQQVIDKAVAEARRNAQCGLSMAQAPVFQKDDR